MSSASTMEGVSTAQPNGSGKEIFRLVPETKQTDDQKLEHWGGTEAGTLGWETGFEPATFGATAPLNRTGTNDFSVTYAHQNPR